VLQGALLGGDCELTGQEVLAHLPQALLLHHLGCFTVAEVISKRLQLAAFTLKLAADVLFSPL
jgi:hypothetical protein